MNNNSSKQILLSVIGVAILVVAVVGVSFAFFSYTREGASVSSLGTGTISFEMTDGTDITLTNQFPLTASEVADLSALTFSVKGYSTYTGGINYEVYVVDANTSEEELDVGWLAEYIHVSITPTGSTPTGYTFTGESNFATTAGDLLTGLELGTDLLIGTGNITNTSSGNAGQGFAVKVWYSADDIIICDTCKTNSENQVIDQAHASEENLSDPSNAGKFFADAADYGKRVMYTEEFNNYTYKLKIKVKALDA